MKNRRIKNYQTLWVNGPKASGLRLAHTTEDAFFAKAIDALCLEVDMCETLEDYLNALCRGMHDLFDLGVRKKDIIEHKLLFQKLLNLGEDVVEGSKPKSDLFYLGLFIDVKLASNWFTRAFYKLIAKALYEIKNIGKFFSEKMKFRLEESLLENNYALYKVYFGPRAFKLIK